MPFELFAQNQTDQDAFKAGVRIVIAIAVVICAAIPVVLGYFKGQAIIGIIGGILSGVTAIFLGCLGGLPMACVFIIIIMSMGDGTTERTRKRKKRRRPIEDDYDDDEEDDDEPRPKKRRRYDEDSDYGRGPR